MGKFNVNDVVNPGEFPLHFKDPMDVQDTLDEAHIIVTTLLGGAFQSIGAQTRRRNEVERSKRRLVKINKRLPVLNVLLNSDKIVADLKKEYEVELFQTEKEKQRLEIDLEDKNIGKVLMDRVTHFVHKEHAMALDEWAKSLAEWFATGAVGPGTVTYDGKQYGAG